MEPNLIQMNASRIHHVDKFPMHPWALLAQGPLASKEK